MKWAAFALALIPQTTWALSCAPVDLQYEFNRAQSSERRYVVVVGEITLDRDTYSVTQNEDGTEQWLYPATFSGASLGHNGFRSGFSTDLIVSVFQGEWCIRAPGPSEHIYFFEATDAGYVHYPSICTSDRSPTAENRRILEDCMAGNGCVSAY